MTSNSPDQVLRMLDYRAVCDLTSVSRATLYLMVRDKEFPKPVQLGKRRVAWRESDVRDWLESREYVSWAA